MSDKPMTPERRKAIGARAAAATEGPWEFAECRLSDNYGYVRFPYSASVGFPGGDAPFIANSREDIPDLLAALEAVEKERDVLRAAAAPFARVARILDKLPSSFAPPDHQPLAGVMPADWPSVGQCRALNRAMGEGELPDA